MTHDPTPKPEQPDPNNPDQLPDERFSPFEPHNNDPKELTKGPTKPKQPLPPMDNIKNRKAPKHVKRKVNHLQPHPLLDSDDLGESD